MFAYEIPAGDGSDTCDYPRAVRELAEQATRRPSRGSSRRHRHKIELVPSGRSEGLVDVAERTGASMIVVGTNGEHPIKGVVLGSVPQNRSIAPPCPCSSSRTPKNGAKLNARARSTGAQGRVSELAALADDLFQTAGVRRSKSIVHTVVGSPGVLDPARGALTMASNLPGWERPAVLTELRRVFGRSTVIENDVDVAALAERDHGHGREISTFAFVSVGSGIGMGIVIDGKLHRGAHGAAGEIAFLPLAPGEVDEREAKRHGALEAAASSAAVVRAARARGLDGHLTARRVFASAAAGDERAGEVVRHEAALVARALAAIVAMVDPELLVLGGGIGRAPGFAAEVASELERHVPFVPEIRVSALGEDAVVEGCLAAGTEQLWQRVLRSRSDQRAL